MATEAGWGPGRVTGGAGHRRVGVREMFVVLRHLLCDGAVRGHQLGAKGFHAEVNVAGSDGIGGLNDLPLFVLLGHGALNYAAVSAPFEPAKAPRSAQRIEMTSAFGSGGTGSN